MSKNTKTVKQPLSIGAKRAIWITAIVLAAVIALSVSLSYILNNDTINPDDSDSNTSGSSTLTISNGDFLYTQSESTSIPYEAQDWAKKTYNDGKTFGDIEDEQKVVMGIINTADSVWADVEAALTEKGLNVTNPLTHDPDGVIDQAAVEEDDDDIANVYMIATKSATTASILSNSFSIPSLTSVKITVWLNAEQLDAGSIASVMVQRSSTSTATETSGKTQYWFAYDLEIEKQVTDGTNGWQKHEFFVFNRSSSSTSVRINVGIGNVYQNVESSGVLFVDDIQYETVTANEYRKHFDATNNQSYIIKSTDTTDANVTSYDWSGATEINYGGKTGVEGYLESDAAKVDGEAYSPFVSTDTFAIYQVNNSQSLTQNISLTGTDGQDEYLHLYFWMRVFEQNENPQASIVDVVLRDVKETDADKSLSKLTNIAAVKDITEDNNCGWKQYHIYVKPDQDVRDAEVSVTIDWSKTGLTHNGQIYVSELMCEVISDTDYSSASSNSTTNIKADMSKTHASTGVTNGTFGYLENTNKTQPENWTPVYAGSNAIYADGKGNVEIAGVLTGTDAVDNKVIDSSDANYAPADYDDEYGYYLAVTNTKATAQGFLSQSISLSANSVYRISVLVKGNPYVYLVDNDLAKGEDGSREKAILGKIETVATNSKMDELLMQPVQTTGWVRYYFIVETADEAVSANIALFNGSIDGATLTTGTVYYDQVCVEQLGSYTISEDTDNEDATLYKVEYTAKSSSGYTDLFETYFANVDGKTTAMNTIEFKDGDTKLANVQVVRLADADKWEEMRTIPEEEEDTEDEEEEDTTTSDSNVDVALLLSVISSILLVSALLVVVVIKAFKRKKA